MQIGVSSVNKSSKYLFQSSIQSLPVFSSLCNNHNYSLRYISESSTIIQILNQLVISYGCLYFDNQVDINIQCLYTIDIRKKRYGLVSYFSWQFAYSLLFYSDFRCYFGSQSEKSRPESARLHGFSNLIITYMLMRLSWFFC